MFAARFALIGWGGSPIPQLDQWDGEALAIYRPWLEGHLTLAQLFQPHLEHHLVFTYLLDLALLKVAGQWDPLIQMTASALVSAMVAGALLVWLCREHAPRRRAWILVLVAAAFASPFAFQDTLWGFQSQFALLIGMALLAIWGLSQRPVGNGRWWVGLVAAALAPLTMAAGGLVGPAIAVAAVVTLAGRRGSRREEGLMLAIGLGFTLFGWLAAAPAPPSTFLLEVRNLDQFFAVFLSSLAWPNCGWLWLAPVALAPCAVLTWQIASGRRPAEVVDRWLLGAAAWACACTAAMAYLRGNAAGTSFIPASRYQDILAVLAMCNGLALVRLVEPRAPGGSGGRAAVRGLAATWTLALAVGVGLLYRSPVRIALQNVQILRQERWNAVLAYQATGSVGPMVRAGIHPDPEVIKTVLDSPEFAPWLPPEMQGPDLKTMVGRGTSILKLTRKSPGSPGAHWVSDAFSVASPAVLLLSRGAERGVHLVLHDGPNTRPRALHRIGYRLGPWREWAAEVSPGRYHLAVDLTGPATRLDFVLPRRICRMSLWTRQVLGWSRELFWAAAVLLAATVGVAVVGAPRQAQPGTKPQV